MDHTRTARYSREALLRSIVHSESLMYTAINSVPNSFHITDAQSRADLDDDVRDDDDDGGVEKEKNIYCLALTRSSTTGRYVNSMCSISRVQSSSSPSPAVVDLHVELDSLQNERPAGEVAGEEEISREEQLRRERQRTRVEGITSFQLFGSHRALVPRGPSLYLYDLHSKKLVNISELHDSLSAERCDHAARCVTPETIGKTKIDAKFSPDGTMVSFVCGGDIYVHHIATHQQVRLTHSARTPGITAGVAEYIMQEEFDRYTGYWWYHGSNDEDDGSGESRHQYRIAYLEVDERDVPIVKIAGGGFDRGAEEFRFPRAGDVNAKSTLKLVEFDEDIFKIDRSESVSGAASIKCCKDWFQKYFPWCEYIVRVGWFPNKPVLWLQLIDREQQRVAFVRLDVDSMQHRTIFEESTDLFINVSDAFHVLEDGSDRIIVGSERMDFHHLYLYECDQIGNYHCTRQITSGEWMVGFQKIWVDCANELVYFTGTMDSPLENHVYVASFASNGKRDASVYRITPPGYYFFHVAFCDRRHTFIASYSNLDCQPRVSVFTKSDASSREHILPTFHLAYDVNFDNFQGQRDQETLLKLNRPEFFEFINSNGDTIYGCIYKPYDHDPYRLRPYPVIQYVYGGPRVQLVANQYNMFINGRLQLLSSIGFIVVLIDGRGSSRRGLKFEGHMRCSMGLFEFEDYKEGIRHLALNRTDLHINLSRVGIFGFSYGGYLSLMALCQHSDFYRCAIAGAPVTDWLLYDTAYTERYMGLPATQSNAYTASSVFNRVAALPNEEDRLLLVHGMLDENVHFRHTDALIEKMVAHGKPYLLKIYPSERHGMRSIASQSDYQLAIIRFFQRALQGEA